MCSDENEALYTKLRSRIINTEKRIEDIECKHPNGFSLDMPSWTTFNYGFYRGYLMALEMVEDLLDDVE